MALRVSSFDDKVSFRISRRQIEMGMYVKRRIIGYGCLRTAGRTRLSANRHGVAQTEDFQNSSWRGEFGYTCNKCYTLVYLQHTFGLPSCIHVLLHEADYTCIIIHSLLEIDKHVETMRQTRVCSLLYLVPCRLQCFCVRNTFVSEWIKAADLHHYDIVSRNILTMNYCKFYSQAGGSPCKSLIWCRRGECPGSGFGSVPKYWFQNHSIR